MHGVFHFVFECVFHVCDCVIVCYKLCGRTYTQYDVYGKYDCAVIARENYMHGIMYIGKRWMLKVRNYNLRGSENEMNLKVLNFIEINKRSGWQVAPLRR